MAAAGSTNAGTIFEKLGLKPFTKCNLVKFYVPALGMASYTTLSISVMNPNIVVRVFPNKDITNYLLGSAICGFSLYLGTRDHMESAPTCPKIVYSVSGAVFFSFGSILAWALLRSFVPPNATICPIVGIGTGLMFLGIGSRYMNFIDGQIKKK